MTLTGKRVDDLLDLNPDKLSASELRQVVSRIASAGNKRLKRLDAAGVSSRAADVVRESGGKFSVKGKSTAELKAEFMREKNFFDRKTSSLSGIKEVQRETVKTLEQRGVTNIDRDKIGETFALYDKLKERDPSVANKNLKYAVINAIAELPDNLDVEGKILAMQEQLEGLYEEQEDLYDEFDGVAEFFDFDEDF